MPNSYSILGCFMAVFLNLQGSALAEDKAPPKESGLQLDFSLELDTIKNNLAWVGQKVDRVTHTIDDFFAEEQKIEQGKARLSFSITSRISEKKLTEYQLGFNLVAHLSKTQNKLNLFVESFSKTDDTLEQASAYDRATAEQQNFIGLSFIYRLTNTLKIKTRTGMGYKEGQLNPHIATSLPYQQTLSEKWSLGLEPELFWYRVEETGQRGYLNFNYRHSDKHHFRATSSFHHYDLDPFWNLAQTLQWQHRLDEYNIITYKTGRLWQWQQTIEKQDTYIEVSWRNRFYDNWLFVTLTPGIHAPIDLNHQTNVYFIVNVEAFSYNH